MELARFSSHGGYSVRGIFSFVLAVLVTALLSVLLVSPITQAADDPVANWKGDSIIYDGHQYYPAGEAETGQSHNLPVGSPYYVHVTDASTASSRQAYIIYFTAGTSPPTETSAQYVEYDYPSNDQFNNAQNQKVIEITPQGEGDQYASSCSVEGIGWVICPVTVFLAEAMDWVFEQISGFVAVQPPTLNDTNSDLYVAWNVMRSFANVAFIVAFLIIIYSQLTSAGISSYGLKKLIPRLIVGALLVNLSFIICALAVDISNILGYSLQDMLIQIRQDTFNIDNDTWSADTTSWANLSGAVLSGGATVAGIAALSAATVGDIGAAIYMLIPLLIGLLLTVLFVLLILAARQAIIIIMIVIAPLAFVAYLLPNTEKWFEKWRELFMTMLIFFPAFSLVFGGSQLAGGIIIQNATNIVMMIFGMAVQVAPLVITPLLLKLSGGLLGRIAGIVNDPRKGLLDRTKNWAGDRAEMRRQKSLGTSWKRNYNPFRLMGKSMADGNQRVKDRTELYKTRAEARYKGRRNYERLHLQQDLANNQKEMVENDLKAHSLEEATRHGSKLNVSSVRLEASKVKVEEMSATSETMLREYRAGKYDTQGNTRLAALQKEMARNVIATTAQKEALARAVAAEQLSYAEAIKSSRVFANGKTLAQIAGGVDKNGAQRAVANALQVLDKARKEILDSVQVIIEDTNATSAEVKQLAQGISVRGIEVTQDTVAAALRMTLGGPDTEQVLAGLKDIDLSFSNTNYTDEEKEELRVIASKALESNAAKPPFVTAGALAAMKQGIAFDESPFSGAYNQSGIDKMIITAIKNEKIDAGKLQVAGKDYAKAILDAFNSAQPGEIDEKAKTRLLRELSITLDESREASEKLGDSKSFLDELKEKLDN